MNFRVDLITEAEQRSGSIISVKGLTRILTFAVPAAIIVVLATAVLEMVGAASESSLLEEKWQITQPRIAEADAARETLVRNEAILADMHGLASSRLAWSAQLRGLIRQVPPTLQLTQLTVGQSVQQDARKGPSRAVTMIVEGRAVGATPDEDVDLFRERLRSADGFAGQTEAVDISSFGADTRPGASKDDRVFRISCQYKPREFK
jgi:hypothetical protein